MDFLHKDWATSGVNPKSLSKQARDHDRWDEQDWAAMVKEINELAAARDALGKVAPTGQPALADAFWVFSNVEPKLVDPGTMNPAYLVNRVVAEEMEKLQETERLRRHTVGDVVGSAMAAVDIEPDLETLFDKSSKQIQAAQDLAKAMQALHDQQAEKMDLDQMVEKWREDNVPECTCDEGDEGDGEGGDTDQPQGQGEGEGEGSSGGGGSGVSESCPVHGRGPRDWQEEWERLQGAQQEQQKLVDQAAAEAQQAGERFEKTMNQGMANIRLTLQEAMQKAAEKAEAQAQQADCWGLEPGELQRMNAAERVALAKRLDNPRFKRIADLFGAMKNLMLTEVSRKTIHATEEVHELVLGQELDRVLPEQLADLANPLTKLDFLRRYAEGELLMYDMKGTEKLAQGGIIFCEDGSGSMHGEREMWAKAVCLCLLHLSRMQKRPMHVIHFGSTNEYRLISFNNPEDYKIDKILDVAELFFGGGPLRVDQRVVTPEGWREIGSLQIGDQVYGPDGKPTAVIGIYPQGELDLYEVTFKDGAKVICDGSHIWTVRDKTTGNPAYVEMTLNQMLAKGLVYHHLNGSRFNFSVPVTEPVVLSEASLPLDPYLLGTLLGDGTLGGGRSVAIHSSEAEHPWVAALPEDVTVTTHTAPSPERCGTYGLKGTGRGRHSKNSLITALQDLGLLGIRDDHKFVPDTYLWGSIDQRLALLCGLLDTDGNTVENGGFEFSNTSLRLCEAVIHLAQSLGGVASLHKGHVRNNERPCWKVRGRIHPDLGAPFRLTRKIAAYKVHPHSYLRSIVSAERVERAEAICIRVDRVDGLFLTEGYVVTHNTDFQTPMRVSLGILQDEFRQKGAVEGDVVFCTDGMCGVPKAFMESFKEEQERLDFAFWGINIGGHKKDEPLYTMADQKVATIQDLLSGEDVRMIFRGMG